MVNAEAFVQLIFRVSKFARGASASNHGRVLL